MENLVGQRGIAEMFLDAKVSGLARRPQAHQREEDSPREQHRERITHAHFPEPVASRMRVKIARGERRAVKCFRSRVSTRSQVRCSPAIICERASRGA